MERRGGGIRCADETAPTFVNCIFADNFADIGGGAVNCALGSAPTFIDCQFLRNRSFFGGAACCAAGSHPYFVNCLFEENIARGPTTGQGGAIQSLYAASPVAHGCTFVRNVAAESGGAAFFYAVTGAVFDHCTFYENSAPLGGTILSTALSAPRFTNCIIACSLEGEAVWTDDDPGPSLGCCNLYGNAGGDWIGPIAGQLGINGNICADPLFCDAPAGDLRLHAQSECLPGANPDCGLIGAWPIGCPSIDVAPEMEARGRLSVIPTPSRQEIDIHLGIPDSESGPVSLAIHDATGRLVRHWAGPVLSAGGRVHWDRRDDSGRPVPPGVYFARLTVGHGAPIRSTLIITR